MASVTAKVTCSSKSETGEGDSRSTLVIFTPDYQDGRNKEWAMATPHLNLQMTLRGDVANLFELRKHYTLTFTASAES